MWKTDCCVASALALVIVGVSVNILMWQIADVTEYIQITVRWGYKNAHISIIVDDVSEIHKTVNYQDSYDTRCDGVSVQPSYCKNLKDIIIAGKEYLIFNCIGISFLIIAIILSCIIMINKSNHNYRYYLKLVVVVSVLLAMICFGVSAGVFLNDFSPNLNSLLNDIIYDIYPILSYINWNETRIGTSLIVIFCAMSASFLALGMMLIVDRKYGDNVNTNDQNAENKLIADNHLGVVPLTNTYGLNDKSIVQTNNDNNNNRVSEPDYVYTQSNKPQYSNTTIYVPIPNDNDNVSRQL